MITEQELLDKIKEVDTEQKDVRNRVSTLKKSLVEAESDMIHCNIRKSDLTEQLRRVRLATVDNDITDYDKDIARFKAALPGILEKDKWNAK